VTHNDRKGPTRYRRRGISLLELLVCIAIVGILLALLIPAVQSVRQLAMRTQCMNQSKQLALGTHSFAAAHRGMLPSIDGDALSANRNRSLFSAILPFMDSSAWNPPPSSHGAPLVAFFICPSDPTYSGHGAHSSYAANAMVFVSRPSLQGTFRDGASNTIAFGEHYVRCQSIGRYYQIYLANSGIARRATFADWRYGDDVPQGDAVPIETFQVTPNQEPPRICWPGIAQTAHAAGMVIALADGSCRCLSSNISSRTYWSAVTPAGNEILGIDWE
jgi:prepilin-type N-terminal cleavage/methylation domain-containing protein